ncbi:MAG: oligosaccharide flippase family protein, partial [Clostridia bacterium]|nr:oligosaccharide flippase family protein [Clostridia bacterium]
MNKNSKKIFSGALILGISTAMAKALGAIYRVPLTAIIGGTGLGLYQMVFPVYTLLLDFSSAGVPNALAKLIASKKGYDADVYAKKVLKVSLSFFLILGAFLSVLTAAFCREFAKAQGNSDAWLAYLYLSPSIFFVCGICCFRGYFQGYMNMTYTALSQITEQTVKLAAGLIFARAFLPDIPKAVAGATLAIALSEFIALIQLLITYAIKSRNKIKVGFGFAEKEYFTLLKEIFSYALPIAVVGMILPFSKVVDSFIIIKTLSAYEENATGLYGLFSGVAITVVGLPVAVCYGIAAVAVPALSGSKGKSIKKNSVKTLLFTLAVSVPCAVLCAIFAPLIINILFRYLNNEEKAVSINLLRLASPCVVLLSV